MAEAPAGQRQEAAVVGTVEEQLRDRQRDELGVGELRSAAGPGSPGQEIVSPHVKCGDEGVEVGAHEASLVDVAVATSDFGTLTNLPREAVSGNSESTV